MQWVNYYLYYTFAQKKGVACCILKPDCEACENVIKRTTEWGEILSHYDWTIWHCQIVSYIHCYRLFARVLSTQWGIPLKQNYLNWLILTNALKTLTLTPPNSFLADQYSYQVTSWCDRELEQQLSYHPTCWLLYSSV